MQIVKLMRFTYTFLACLLFPVGEKSEAIATILEDCSFLARTLKDSDSHILNIAASSESAASATIRFVTLSEIIADSVGVAMIRMLLSNDGI